MGCVLLPEVQRMLLPAAHMPRWVLPLSCCLRPFSTCLAIPRLLSPAMLQSILSHCSPQNIPLLVDLLPQKTGALHSLQNWVLPQYLLILLRT